MALHIPHKKLFLYIFITVASLILVYSCNIPQAGYTETDWYFHGNSIWSALTANDLPVVISKTNQPQTNNIVTPTPKTGRTFNPVRCESDATLCNKIVFNGDFSESSKTIYRWLIIKQVRAIDALLGKSPTIADTLYSITLDNGKGSRRWWAGNATIMINLGNMNSQDEFLEILTHELGHIVDLWVLKGKSSIVQTSFSNIDRTSFSADDFSLGFYRLSWLNNTTRSENAWALAFVGWYAMNDPFEDFAETFNMYLNHHNVFAILVSSDPILKKKYMFMDSLFHSKYIKADAGTANDVKNHLDERPWDSTKWY